MEPLLLNAGCREATAARSERREATAAGQEGEKILIVDAAGHGTIAAKRRMPRK